MLERVSLTTLLQPFDGVVRRRALDRAGSPEVAGLVYCENVDPASRHRGARSVVVVPAGEDPEGVAVADNGTGQHTPLRCWVRGAAGAEAPAESESGGGHADDADETCPEGGDAGAAGGDAA